MRASFPKGEQNEFINKILSKISIKEAANLCNLSERTIRDWRREKFLPDFDALRKLCRKTRISLPPNIELKNDFWYTAYSSPLGALAVLKKYGRIGGDPKYRKKRWYEWWNREGRLASKIIKQCIPIREPKFSEELAEFVGIMLGDGGITERQISVSLNSKNEEEYSRFVKCLMTKLFDVYVGTFYDEKYSSLDLLVSRTELVRFCTGKLGLVQGNKVKQQVDIPEWIKQNKSYLTACVRGLMDTEGCVFSHRYRVNGRIYSYKKIAFKNFSYPLIKSVYAFLNDIGLHHPRIAKNNKEVRIENEEDVQKYLNVVGFHNYKNLKRYKN